MASQSFILLLHNWHDLDLGAIFTLTLIILVCRAQFSDKCYKKDSAHDYTKTNSKGLGIGAIEIYAT